jgi:hypothetical protein
MELSTTKWQAGDEGLNPRAGVMAGAARLPAFYFLGVESARPEEQPMLVSVQEVQNHIEDLRKDLASAVKRAQLFKAHGEIAQREKKTVLLLRA